MGAPKSAVTELTGNVPWFPGIWEIKSQASMMVDPHKIDAGMLMRWFDE